MTIRYSIKGYNKEGMARAIGVSLPISTKHSIEICGFIRNKNLSKAREMLQKVVAEETAVPFKRFKGGVGHKKKGPGRYPKKSSLEIIKLLNTVEANAQFKGLNTANLFIKHICANKASRQWHYGRKRRRKMKRTHVEIVVEERITKEKKEETKQEKKKEVVKKTNEVGAESYEQRE